MRFCNSSALVPFCVDQPRSEAARALYDQDPPAVRAVAMRLLRVHPLRTADSLQLAAALEWAGTPPNGELVTFDERLKSAARLEGLAVV